MSEIKPHCMGVAFAEDDEVRFTLSIDRDGEEVCVAGRCKWSSIVKFMEPSSTFLATSTDWHAIPSKP